MADQDPPAFDQVVPEFGGVGIPANMGPEERSRFNAAMTRKLKEEKPGAKQPPKTNWIDDAVKWAGDAAVDLLPTAGGIIGGIAGASAAGPVGAIGGAALGGAGGEAWKQNIKRMRGADAPSSPTDAALAIGKEGGIQGAIGAASAGVGAAARGAAPTVMRTALGNTEAVLGRAPDVATTALKTGATVTRSGLHKLDDLLASKALGLADQKAVEATREAVAAAWKRLSLEQSKTLFGATAGNPAFRSLMAQGLYHVAAPIANVSAQGIRLLLGIANASEQR